MTKDEIRLKMRAARRSLTKEFITDASRAIQSSLLSLGCIRSADTVMMYMSAFNEPKTDTLLAELTGSGKRIAVPVSNKTDHTITPSVVSGSFVKGEYGICEPDVLQPITADEIDVVIVPALAFDRCGNRLGFGKGYYDRLLSELGGVKIGVGYEFQLLDKLPVSEHDIAMDIIVTEREIYNDF